jgi:cell division septal protein FtsQ
MNKVKTNQAPSENKRRFLATIWQVLCWVSSSFIKVTCLIVCLMMISVLFLAGYQYLLHSPYIRLEKVIISGVQDPVRRELLDLSGLSADMTLLAINLDDLKKNMERHPWVRRVEVKKEYPHTIRVKAARERPWAVVSMGGLYYMNRQGELFKEVDISEDVDFPVITGSLLNEEQRAETLRLATHVLKVLESRGEEWMKEEISEIHLRNSGNISLYFRSLPAMVQVGVRDIERKIVDLGKIVAHLRETQKVWEVRRINLHYRDGAVVSFRKG